MYAPQLTIVLAVLRIFCRRLFANNKNFSGTTREGVPIGVLSVATGIVGVSFGLYAMALRLCFAGGKTRAADAVK